MLTAWKHPRPRLLNTLLGHLEQLTEGVGSLGELGELATFLVDPEVATLPFGLETYTYS